MSDLDDLPIERDEDQSWDSSAELFVPPDESAARSPTSRRRLLLAVVAVVVVLGGVATWQLLRRPAAPEVGRPVASTPVAAAVAQETVADPEPEPPVVEWALPSLAESDGVLQSLVAALSSHPGLAGWLVNEGLIRRFTLVVANVAFDDDPRVHVPFLRPEAPFTPRAVGEGWQVAPESFRRFDLVADVFESIDSAGAVDLYLRFLPLVEQSYGELGYPGDFDRVLREAASKIFDTPRAGADLAVSPWINRFVFEDSQLEELAPAQKILLGMGPRNRSRIENHVRRLLAELDQRTLR